MKECCEPNNLSDSDSVDMSDSRDTDEDTKLAAAAETSTEVLTRLLGQQMENDSPLMTASCCAVSDW